MSTLTSKLIALSKNKRVNATVMEYFGGLVTVKVGQGNVMRNLKLIGGPVKKGDMVVVDFSSQTPIVFAETKLPEAKAVVPASNTRYADQKFHPPIVPANTESILLFSPAVDVMVFPATSAGLIAALAASHSGDGVSIPLCTITGGPWTIPDGVEVFGSGYNSFLNGTVGAVAGGNSYLSNLRVSNLLQSGSSDVLYETSGVCDASNNGVCNLELPPGFYQQINPRGINVTFMYETIPPGPFIDYYGHPKYMLSVYARMYDVAFLIFDANNHSNNSNILSYEVVNTHYAKVIMRPNWGGVFWFQAGETYDVWVSGSLGWRFSVIKAIPNGVLNTHGVMVDDPNHSIPESSDRSVKDSLAYPERHANDVDVEGGIHHTLAGIKQNIITNNKIQLYHPGADNTTEFDVTSDGFEAATAAAVAYDLIYLPACVIGGDHVLKDSVSYVGLDADASELTGQITGGSDAVLSNCFISRFANDASTITAIVGPTQGSFKIENCNIVLHQLGSGSAVALHVNAGNIRTYRTQITCTHIAVLFGSDAEYYSRQDKITAPTIQSGTGTIYTIGTEYDSAPLSTLISQWSDRAAWDDVSYAARHAKDINDAVLLRHLPAPSGDVADAGKTAILNPTATAWIMGTPAIGGGGGIRGLATLVAGTVTVACTNVTANSLIFLTVQTLGTVLAPQALRPSARVVETSFTITSADPTDTSTVAWQIVEP